MEMRMEQPLNVLVADDHEGNRRLLSAIFESLGCQVTTVTNGADALAASGDFDLICLDRHMSPIGGDEVAAKVGSRAFLMACTSDPRDAPDDFDVLVAKPFSCAAIYEAVEAARAWRADNNVVPWLGSAANDATAAA